jgi:hypothetical protein
MYLITTLHDKLQYNRTLRRYVVRDCDRLETLRRRGTEFQSYCSGTPWKTWEREENIPRDFRGIGFENMRRMRGIELA